MDEKKRAEKILLAGEKQPSMKRRDDYNDYRGRRMYMITMEVEGRRPVLVRRITGACVVGQKAVFLIEVGRGKVQVKGQDRSPRDRVSAPLPVLQRPPDEAADVLDPVLVAL